MSVTTISESSSAMFQTAPMRTLPVIFCLMCFFFPAIASAQLAPGLKAHAYDLSVAEIDAIKAAVTSILIKSGNQLGLPLSLQAKTKRPIK